MSEFQKQLAALREARANNTTDTIKRQAAIEWLDRWKGYLDEDMIMRMKIGLKRDIPSVEMTVDELKKIANSMGYNIIKKQEYIKLLPCKCGCTRREQWYGSYREDDARILLFYYLFKCSNCGAEAKGKTEREARLNWNRMVSEK